jgi:hypothetical protein
MRVVQLASHQPGVDPPASMRRLHPDPRDSDGRHRDAAGNRHREDHGGGAAHHLAVVDRGQTPRRVQDGALLCDFLGPDMPAERGFDRVHPRLELVLGDRSDLDVHPVPLELSRLG